MNQKNLLGLDHCFKDLDDPIELFKIWFSEAEKKEINDHNALSLATSDKQGNPSVRMVLLKGLNSKGFIFYTNLDSPKSIDLKENPKAAMCFHWKGLLRQIRIFGKISLVDNKEADKYFDTRSIGSKIGAWASKQSSAMSNRSEILKKINDFEKKFNEKKILRPHNWSGWCLTPSKIEFWLNGANRIHERLSYKRISDVWKKEILYP